MKPNHGHLGLAFALLFGTASLASCAKTEVKEATEVIVVVDADRGLRDKLAKVHVDVLDEAGKRPATQHDFTLDDRTTLPISFGVYQPAGGAEWFMLLARGLDESDRPLVQYRTIAHFEKSKTGHLQIQLSSACEGQLCDDQQDQTCNATTGRCEQVTREGSEPNGENDAGGIEIEDAGLGDAGADAGPSAAVDAAAEAAVPIMTEPVPPSLAGATSFGGRRSDGTITVYDDGFEQGARVCTADGKFCVTGGFSP